MSIDARVDSASASRMAPRVLRLLRPHRRRVAFLTLAIFVAAVLGVAAPLLTKVIFDQALFPKEGGPRLGLLGTLVGVMMALVVLAAVTGIFQTYLATTIGQLVMHDLRDRLYRHLQRMSLRFFTGTRTGEIQSRISNDVGGVGSIVSKGAVSVASNAVFLAISFAAMAVLSWELALISAGILPFFAYMSIRVGRVKRRVAASTQQTLATMTSITQETLSVSGALLGKVFDREREASARYQAESQRLAELGIRQEMVGRVFLGLAQSFFLVAPAVTYIVAGLAIAGGSTRFTPGTLVAFTALQVRLFVPLRELLQTSMEMQSSAALFERIFEYLDLRHDIVDGPNARPLSKSRVAGGVAFRDVWFRYSTPPPEQAAGLAPAREWTLREIDLDVRPGQLAALVGPTGAGKTTLAYLAARLYDVDRGSVTIDGVDVREIQLSSLAEIVGIVTQETYLFNASVRENLLYAQPGASDAELVEAARLAHIHERILELPDGYDTVVGERGYRMSGGEKQRLAIARAILRDPRVLVLDEATSALDSASERLIQDALAPLMAERTTIAIAHRLSTVLNADVVFVLDQGRIVERGNHEELLAADGLYARLYAQQFRPEARPSRAGDGVLLPARRGDGAERPLAGRRAPKTA